MTSHRLLPKAKIVVPDDELADYQARLGNCLRSDKQIETIPASIKGAGRVKDWIVQNSPGVDCVVLYDDDITKCYSIAGFRARALNPVEIESVVENAALCAHGAGALVFGFNQSANPDNFVRNDPFRFNIYCSGVIGIIGKTPRWDRLLSFKGDPDLCLQELLERRIVWQDSRYTFIAGRDKNPGGNSLFRTPERIEIEKDYLQKKWKAHISFGAKKKYKTQDKASLVVERRQKIGA